MQGNSYTVCQEGLTLHFWLLTILISLFGEGEFSSVIEACMFINQFVNLRDCIWNKNKKDIVGLHIQNVSRDTARSKLRRK